MREVEQQYLNAVKLLPHLYYNINYDADRINYTPEVLKKMSIVKMGKQVGKNNPFYGKKHSNESISKIKLRRSTQIITDETKKKLSLSVKNSWLKRRLTTSAL